MLVFQVPDAISAKSLELSPMIKNCPLFPIEWGRAERFPLSTSHYLQLKIILHESGMFWGGVFWTPWLLCILVYCLCPPLDSKLHVSSSCDLVTVLSSIPGTHNSEVYSQVWSCMEQAFRFFFLTFLKDVKVKPIVWGDSCLPWIFNDAVFIWNEKSSFCIHSSAE